MKITFDNIIFSLQRAGGISIYWFELLKRMDKGKSYRSYGVPNQNIFSKQLEFEPEKESFLPTTILRYLPFAKRLPIYSIFHSSYYRFSLQSEVATITTVYDFTYEYYVKGFKKYLHSSQKRMAIANSAGIICISENTKRDLFKFYPNTDSDKVRVIYIGVGDNFFPLTMESDAPSIFFAIKNKQYILFVGDRSPYKNFNKAIEVVNKFPDMCLVVVGGKLFCDSELELLKPLKGRFFSFKGVSSENLNWLYNNAFCLLYPSSYEGFGIPILEAMKAGCPVISTNLSSMPEVAGEAGLLVDKITVKLLSEKVNLLFDANYRVKVIQKGIFQSNKFSWDKCFEETMQFYQDMWAKKFGGKS